MKLTDLIPTADILLALSPEELAGYVLEYFQLIGPPDELRIHPASFPISTETEGYAREKLEECNRALMEAWSCLEREGLVIQRPGDSHGWYILSRRGKQIKENKGYQAFRNANLFRREAIHPDLVEGVYPLFIRGDYETAIFKSFKLVEVALRTASGPGFEAQYGTDLMKKAFHPDSGPLTSKSEQKAEREALMFLFSGAIGRFKNPSSHRHVAITDPKETIEMIQSASHLLRIVDDRKPPPH